MKICKNYHSSDLERVLDLKNHFFKKKYEVGNFSSKYGFWPKSGQNNFFSQIFFFKISLFWLAIMFIQNRPGGG